MPEDAILSTDLMGVSEVDLQINNSNLNSTETDCAEEFVLTTQPTSQEDHSLESVANAIDQNEKT